MRFGEQRSAANAPLTTVNTEVNPNCVERCPKCGSKEIQRSRRKNILELTFGFLVLPWRCTVCYVRFYRPSWMKGVPRRMNVMKHFDAAPVAAAQNAEASENLLHPGKKTAPRFVQRDPMLGFFPARRQMRHMQDAMTLRAQQLRS